MASMRTMVFAGLLPACGTVEAPIPAPEVEAEARHDEDEPDTPIALPGWRQVTRLEGTDVASSERPHSPHPLTVTATRTDDSVEVLIRDLLTYCEPAPGFDARIVQSTLEVKHLTPGGAVASCVGLHRAKLRIEDVPPTVTTVELLSVDREVVGTASL